MTSAVRCVRGNAARAEAGAGVWVQAAVASVGRSAAARAAAHRLWVLRGDGGHGPAYLGVAQVTGILHRGASGQTIEGKLRYR